MTIRSLALTAFNTAVKTAKKALASPRFNRAASNVLGAGALITVCFSFPAMLAAPPIGLIGICAGLGIMNAADALHTRAVMLERRRREANAALTA